MERHVKKTKKNPYARRDIFLCQKNKTKQTNKQNNSITPAEEENNGK